MVTIGSLSWVAKVENVGDAQSKADDLADSMEQADEKAQGVNDSTGTTTDRLGGLAGGAVSVTRRMTTMSGILSLATSALFFLGAQATALVAKLGGVAAIAAKISGFVGTLVALGKGFVAWLAAGSAGALAFAAALGAAAGLFVVWILHITGVMDWIGRLGQMIGVTLPDWARDGLLMLISIFAGPLAVIGGFINGFIEGVIEGGLVQGIRTGIARAGEVLNVFSGAWERTLGRIRGLVGDAVSWIGDKWDSLVETTKDMGSGLTNAITDGLKGVWNTVIPSSVGFPSVQLPSVTIDAGPLGSTSVGGQTVFEGFSFDLPQLATGGRIESAGAAMLHEDELVVPADVSRNITDETDALTGGGLTIQELTVEIGDQTLDLSTLTLLDMEELARMIAEETGREVETLI